MSGISPTAGALREDRPLYARADPFFRWGRTRHTRHRRRCSDSLKTPLRLPSRRDIIELHARRAHPDIGACSGPRPSSGPTDTRTRLLDMSPARTARRPLSTCRSFSHASGVSPSTNTRRRRPPHLVAAVFPWIGSTCRPGIPSPAFPRATPPLPSSQAVALPVSHTIAVRPRLVPLTPPCCEGC